MRIIFILLLLTGSFTMNGQEDVIAKYKAMFTLNFIRYIGWPEDAKQGDFVIGVVRDAMIAEYLQSQSAGKKYGYQNIVIKEFRKIEEITDCQILYFANSYSFAKNAAVVKQKLGGKNSLIISETEGAISDGSIINFVVRDGKLKFELSQQNANAFGIKLSNSLTALSNSILVN
ncbi:MAG: YfiR family protein [Salinivirgaceae bacterium]|nr:YfiR family protein [Salinivirgaceae bacterium]